MADMASIGQVEAAWGDLAKVVDVARRATEGFLRGKPVEMMPCKTVDLEVPATAEIVLEGYVDLGELRRLVVVPRRGRRREGREPLEAEARDDHGRDRPERHELTRKFDHTVLVRHTNECAHGYFSFVRRLRANACSLTALGGRPVRILRNA